MRKPLEILCVALLGGAIALAFSQGPPQAQAQERAARWDYKVFRLDPRDYKDKLDWKAAERQGGREGAEAIFYEHVLDSLAKDGWELVQSEQRTPLTTYFYLRKRL
tara:strand:+ start:841 stop:1158 length:318 start_codon:yes stop_codon:yes gene_type:complete